jgi:hypothetical protein
MHRRFTANTDKETIMVLRVSVLAMVLTATSLFLLGARAQDKKDEPKKEDPKEVVVKDELTNADLKDKVRTECFCKTYTFKMVEGKTYQIDMIAVYDTYLRLENAAGDQVAADDDSGGNLQARIIYPSPKTQDYTIICTTYSGGVTGKFNLTVRDVTKK